MKYLLIGGAPSTGKTSSITRLTYTLITAKGYKIFSHWNYPPTASPDFRVILEGFTKGNKKIKILINSASDDMNCINNLMKFIEENKDVDIIITSIRDIEWPRTTLLAKLNFKPSDFVLEIPLSKNPRKTTRWSPAMIWYESTFDNLVLHSLYNQPFNI